MDPKKKLFKKNVMQFVHIKLLPRWLKYVFNIILSKEENGKDGNRH